MLNIDWRSAAEYRHTKTIPAAGFAWEFLRRDADYQRDYQTISHGQKPAVEVLEAFARRWGLRFPCRSRSSV